MTFNYSATASVPLGPSGEVCFSVGQAPCKFLSTLEKAHKIAKSIIKDKVESRVFFHGTSKESAASGSRVREKSSEGNISLTSSGSACIFA
jgi:hypothetical protein